MVLTRGLDGCGGAGWGKTALLAAGLALVFLGLYLLPAILYRPLAESAEARVGVVAREMLQSGDYMVPTLGGERRGFKPPLPYWLAAGSAELMLHGAAPDERVLTRAVLIPPAVCAALTVFFLVLQGGLFFGRAAGVLAGLIQGLALLVLRFAQMGYPDCELMFACGLMLAGAMCVVCSPRPPLTSALAFGVGLGLAILVKEPIPFLVLAGPLIVELALRHGWSTRKVLLFLMGLVLAAAIAVPWFFVLAQHTAGGWTGLLQERLGMWQAGHLHHDRWVFYFYKFGEALLPWTPLLLCAWVLYWYWERREPSAEDPTRRTERQGLRFLCLAVGLGFLAFYASAKQQNYYLLPLVPPFALASGCILSRFRNPGGRKEELLAWTQLALGLLLGAALIALPLLLSSPQMQSALHLRIPADSPLLSLSWAICVPAGAALALLHFFCARQWVEGRPLLAVSVLAGVACAGGLAWSVHWTHQTRQNVALYTEAPRLKAELAKLGPNLRVYAMGVPLPVAMFHLNRPIKGVDDLAAEPLWQTGPAAPPRALLMRRRDVTNPPWPWLRQMDLAPYVSAGETPLVALRLPPERDWPLAARVALSQFGDGPPARETDDGGGE